MTPDNTLREEIEKLLYAKVTSFQAVDYEELTDAILSVIKNRLPKEHENIYPPFVEGEKVGWNDCLSKVKQALDIESKS